jgi:hypothetical protein
MAFGGSEVESAMSAATPAASSITKQPPETRAADWPSRVIDAQRPAHAKQLAQDQLLRELLGARRIGAADGAIDDLDLARGPLRIVPLRPFRVHRMARRVAEARQRERGPARPAVR